MPTISIKSTGHTARTNAALSILNALMRQAVPIMHQCGGKAVCGTCRIRIISGAEYLSPKNEREITRLTAMNAGPDIRLACQTYARGDIEIEVLNKIPKRNEGTLGNASTEETA